MSTALIARILVLTSSLLLVGSAPTGPLRGEFASTADGELAVLARVACTASCSQCFVSTEHQNTSGGGSHSGVVTHACLGGNTSCNYHGCNTSMAPAQASDTSRSSAVGRGVVASVSRLVPERGVVQEVLPCGAVVAQVAIPDRSAHEHRTVGQTFDP